MPVHNHDIAEQFSRLADLLEVEGANPFRVRAYRNAARLWAAIRGAWPKCYLPLLEKVERRTPPALSELMRI
jgi:DNA polymerase (family X)